MSAWDRQAEFSFNGDLSMERYFFRANYRGITVNDDIGEEFSMLHDAEVYATVVANELARNRTQVVTISVLAEDGTLLATVATSSEGFLQRATSRMNFHRGNPAILVSAVKPVARTQRRPAA
jgi:hypothetical protein